MFPTYVPTPAPDYPLTPAGPQVASIGAAAAPASPEPGQASSQAAAPAVPAQGSTLKPRSRTHILEWPVEYDGRTYRTVTVGRPTFAQVATFFDELADRAEADPNSILRLPVFTDGEGNRIPDAVFDALDDDDAMAVMEDIGGFLPARLRRLLTSETSTPAPGEATAPTSSTSSAAPAPS